MKSKKEKKSEKEIIEAFNNSPDTVSDRLHNFCKYVSRQDITKFLSLYEIYKQILEVEGCVIECGVFKGGSLMAWSKLSSILEPVNWKRKIYGFDTFEGFPNTSDSDIGFNKELIKKGYLDSNSYDELSKLIDLSDMDRFLGHIPKVQLIKGDAVKTIPKFIEENKHILISLLYMDFDLYEPTMTAFKYFVPRMPKGSIIIFDNTNHPNWPGEVLAILDSFDIGTTSIRRTAWDSTLCYTIIGN